MVDREPLNIGNSKSYVNFLQAKQKNKKNSTVESLPMGDILDIGIIVPEKHSRMQVAHNCCTSYPISCYVKLFLKLLILKIYCE